MAACRPIRSSPGCARRAACSPRTRRGCCGRRPRSPAELDALVARRVDGRALEALLGWAEFCGLRIAVDPGVFVPRRRTAFLVAQAVRRWPAPGAVVVDLCCGTGAVGAAIGRGRPGVEVHAADVDPAAVALRPPQPAAGRSTRATSTPRCPTGCAGGSTCSSSTRRTCRPPRSPPCRPRPATTSPRVALDGGADGLDVQRRVAAGAPRLAAARRRAADRDGRRPGAAHRRAVRRCGPRPAGRPTPRTRRS